jgi:hypothetical protein
MKQFDEKIKQILEDVGVDAGAAANTTTTAFGPGQSHPAQVGKSGDFYAPGDARNIFGTKSKKTKFKPPGFKKGKVLRRSFPGM